MVEVDWVTMKEEEATGCTFKYFIRCHRCRRGRRPTRTPKHGMSHELRFALPFISFNQATYVQRNNKPNRFPLALTTFRV